MRIRCLGLGMYGAHISTALLADGHDVFCHEIAASVFASASGAIPARLHMGQHYSRSKLTRQACQEHQAEFMSVYGDFTHGVGINIYAIAEYDSLVDIGTYKQVLRGEIEFITIDRPAEFGLRNVEGAILTGERHILVDKLRDHFTKLLDGHIEFGESAEHIRVDADSLGIKMDRVRIVDLTPPPELFSNTQVYDIFSPAEVEREPISLEISKAIEEFRPARIFVDSFGHFRSLAADKFHRRRLTQSFFRFATRHNATLLVSSEDRQTARDVDGVIELQFSNDVRSLAVTKFRGSDFHAGHHPIRLTSRGLEVFPNAA